MPRGHSASGLSSLEAERIEAFESAQRSWPVVGVLYVFGALVVLAAWFPATRGILGLPPLLATMWVGAFVTASLSASVAYRRLGIHSTTFRRLEQLETYTVLGMLFSFIYATRGAPLQWVLLLAFVGAGAASPGSGANPLRLVPLAGVLTALLFLVVAKDTDSFVSTLLFTVPTTFLGNLLHGQQSNLARALDEREELRQLLGTARVEDERRRIARDLHDGVAGDLTSLTAQLDLLRADLSEPSPDMAALHHDLALLRQRSERGVDDLRSIVWALSYPEGTLGDTLRYAESRCRELCGHRTLTFECAESNPDLRLDGSLRLHVLRVLQETVRNALRHGNAENVTVQVRVSGDQLELLIEDDGIGLVAPKAWKRGGGLANIERRARSYGGRLAVTPGAENRGTRLQVLFVVPAVQA